MNTPKSNFSACLLFVSLLSGLCSSTFCQNSYPRFETNTLNFAISKTLNLLSVDSLNTKGDSIIYNLQGQVFSGEMGRIQKLSDGFNGISKRSTPWQTVTELMAAYETRSVSKILDLFDVKSRGELEKSLKSKGANSLLSILSNLGLVRALVGFEYNSGYFVVLESDSIGVFTNYLRNINGKYLMSVIDDKSPILWNVAQYFRVKPQPLTSPQVISSPDSAIVNTNINLELKLENGGNWLLFFTEGTTIPLQVVLDNGQNDEDLNIGNIKVSINVNSSFELGFSNMLVTEANYPLTKINQDVINKALKIPIKVYE